MSLTSDEAVALGKRLRAEHNLLIGSFAAELIGESYPFSKAMAEVVFRGFTDEALGRKFATWIDG